jgi:hypothetical protein
MANDNMVASMIVEYFGSTKLAVEFMRRFAGTTLHVPSTKTIERLARDHAIVAALRHDPRTQVVRRLSQLHGLPMRDVTKVFRKLTGHTLTDARGE